ncbi:MAG TPA: hypothetical protein VHF25_14425 [Nitriliruptorales bacterium]|nr:hypothetical protein [Nitriliruptorales bacterium]
MKIPGRREPIDNFVYAVVVGSLALYLVIGVIAWSWMILAGVSIPEGFTTVLSTIVGGLIGIVAPQGKPAADQTVGEDITGRATTGDGAT